MMATLRSPDGCPWDLEQTPATLSRHLLEEAYETVEAIDSSDWDHLCEELGDLLLQIVFQSRMAEESGRFDLADVIEGITVKLVRRHPHIFGSTEVDSAEQVSINWDRIKRQEEGDAGSLVRMPAGLPAMMAAMKIQGQAARSGFDWSRSADVVDKLDEEIEELREVAEGPPEDAACEIGDILFTVVNLARHMEVDPEAALRSTCAEFVRRYSIMEEIAFGHGREFESLSIDEKEELWQEAKRREAPGGPR